jgi:hypothetical protein
LGGTGRCRGLAGGEPAVGLVVEKRARKPLALAAVADGKERRGAGRCAQPDLEVVDNGAAG